MNNLVLFVYSLDPLFEEAKDPPCTHRSNPLLVPCVGTKQLVSITGSSRARGAKDSSNALSRRMQVMSVLPLLIVQWTKGNEIVVSFADSKSALRLA